MKSAPDMYGQIYNRVEDNWSIEEEQQGPDEITESGNTVREEKAFWLEICLCETSGVIDFK